MLRVGRYIFKCAESPEEYEAIHRLNYRTFVDEVHQYPSTDYGRLVDKFHDKNAYFIAMRAQRIVGMISAHGQPPFSVATRLPHPEILDRPGIRPLEVRLLAVEPAERHSIVLIGLLWSFYKFARDNDYTDLFISGVADRAPLYQRLGFEPLGPAVPSGDAMFTPMSVSVGQLQSKIQRLLDLLQKHVRRAGETEWLAETNDEVDADYFDEKLVCLLPGPGTTALAVRQAFQQPSIYHRGGEFIKRFEAVRRQLTRMTKAPSVALLNGSGTLANEVVAATLAASERPGRGVMLVNGEFGQRLLQQAHRFGLNPRVLEWPWGRPWDLDEIEAALEEEPMGSWVWGVHQESSTGVLNDMQGLVERCRSRAIRVCADCISSLGAVSLDLEEVYLATGATGKSLGSYAGMAIVFANAESLKQVDTSRVPSYLDLNAALATKGPRYTFPSSVLLAAQAALGEYATPELARMRTEGYAALGSYVRQQLRELGLNLLADENDASPVVTTFAPPNGESTEAFVTRCRSWGFAIGGQSTYLANKRLVQVATMGSITFKDCAPLFDHLRSWLRESAPVLVG